MTKGIIKWRRRNDLIWRHLLQNYLRFILRWIFPKYGTVKNSKLMNTVAPLDFLWSHGKLQEAIK